MSFQRFKSDSFCVGGRHRSATKNIYGNITSKGNKVLIGYCSNCDLKKSMAVSDNSIQAKDLGDLFKHLGKRGLNVSKKMAKKYLKILAQLLITLNFATAAASRNSKN